MRQHLERLLEGLAKEVSCRLKDSPEGIALVYQAFKDENSLISSQRLQLFNYDQMGCDIQVNL